MGSFNINGFHSHLPIQCGDEIGLIVCAQVKTDNINLALEPVVNLYPIMAPVYGKYGDSFIMDNVDRNSYTAELFKQHTGFSIEEFIDANARNGNVSVSTPDNHNQFDDIPGYQKIISCLITEPYEKPFSMTKEKLSEMEPSVREQYESIIKHFDDLDKERYNITYCPIYEHKRVLEVLIEAGKKLHNYKNWEGKIVDFSKDYDDVVKCISLIKNEKTNLFTRYLIDVDDELSELNADLVFTHFNQTHIMDYFKAQNNSFVLYRIADNIDYERLKPEFMDAIYLDSGLDHMGGIYQVCRYGYQEYCGTDFMNLHKVMNEILDEKHKKGIDTLLY